MWLQRLFERTGIDLLKRSLSAAALRHEVLASNIANVETPGYRRKEVQFEDQLKESLEGRMLSGIRTDTRHMPIGRQRVTEVSPRVIVDNSPELRSGVNNVDIDLEMAELAKNQIYFSATATVIARKFRGLKEAIRGRM